jgi:hypothetical protein
MQVFATIRVVPARAARRARARGRACILGIGDRAARIRERLARFVTSFDVPIS